MEDFNGQGEGATWIRIEPLLEIALFSAQQFATPQIRRSTLVVSGWSTYSRAF